MIAVMYHYVGQAPHGLILHSLDISAFRRQLDYFTNNYTIINASELQDNDVIKNVNNGLLLTFDDGLRDHYDIVIPELEKRGLSAFFFVPTAILGQNRLLNVHRLHALLASVSPDRLLPEIETLIVPDMIDHESAAKFSGEIYRLQTSNLSSETRIKLLLNYRVGHEHADTILQYLTSRYLDEERLFGDWYMTPDNIREINVNHVVGAHSHDHRVLSRLTPTDQSEDIRKSVATIADLTGVPCRWFCYPFGGPATYNQTTTKILESCGVNYAFAVDERPVSTADIEERYGIPRFDCISFTA